MDPLIKRTLSRWQKRLAKATKLYRAVPTPHNRAELDFCRRNIEGFKALGKARSLHRKEIQARKTQKK